MDFEKICMVFTMQEPFYGILLSSMDKAPTDKIDTIGVARNGNVFKLWYNPTFISQLTFDQTLVILKHECLHLAFNHVGDFWDKPPENATDAKIRGWAEDMEVNSYCNMDIMSNQYPVTAGIYGWGNMLGTKEYYTRLKDLVNQQGQQQSQQQSSNASQVITASGKSNSSQSNDDEQDDNHKDNSKQNGNQSSQSQQSQQNHNSNNNSNSGRGDGSGQQGQNNMPKPKNEDYQPQLLDNHDMWPNDTNSAELTSQLVEDLLANAAEECEKTCGSLPSEMEVRINGIRSKRKPKPVTDWKKYVRRYLGNEFTEYRIKTKRRYSKRFPDAAGSKHRRKSHILVGIDTSGSISMPEYNEFFEQIKTIRQHASFHVIECDARIQYEYDFVGRQNQSVHGGGGTSFAPVIDRFLKERKKYDALVYFTDGCASIPSNTPKETLWVISSKGDKHKEKYTVNGASVVFIKPTM